MPCSPISETVILTHSKFNNQRCIGDSDEKLGYESCHHLSYSLSAGPPGHIVFYMSVHNWRLKKENRS